MWGSEEEALSASHSLLSTSILPTVSQFSYLTYPPGKLFAYSNLGFTLLGMLIERVSSLPYHQYVSQRILKPLEMNNSFFLPPTLQQLEELYTTNQLLRGNLPSIIIID